MDEGFPITVEAGGTSSEPVAGASGTPAKCGGYPLHVAGSGTVDAAIP
jgi:hypothetical protein